jgi:hypothetical protein
VPSGCGFYKVHDKLSKVTETRKKCLPFEGTLDFWVLLFITLLNVFVFIYGIVKLAQDGQVVSLRGSEQQNVKMIALVFALVEATPGVLFLWCAAAHAPTALLHRDLTASISAACIAPLPACTAGREELLLLVCVAKCIAVSSNRPSVIRQAHASIVLQVHGLVPVLPLHAVDCGATCHHARRNIGDFHRVSRRSAVLHNSCGHQLATARLLT